MLHVVESANSLDELKPARRPGEMAHTHARFAAGCPSAPPWA